MDEKQPWAASKWAEMQISFSLMRIRSRARRIWTASTPLCAMGCFTRATLSTKSSAVSRIKLSRNREFRTDRASTKNNRFHYLLFSSEFCPHHWERRINPGSKECKIVPIRRTLADSGRKHRGPPPLHDESQGMNCGLGGAV